MTSYIGTSHLPRRWPRQGHRPGKIRGRVQRGRPRLWQRRRLDDNQGPHRAHRRRRSAEGPRRARRSHPREPAAHGGQRQGLSRRCRAREGLAVSVRSTTTRSCSTASRSPWCWPRTGRPPATPPRWCASNTRRRITSPTCTRRRARRSWSRSPRSRAAMPRRRLRPRRCATRPNISSRSSTTIRWSCSPPRWCGTATASSRSTTRRRACRTCSAICAACSA